MNTANTDPEITLHEMRHLFDETVPMEAIEVLMDGDITTKQARLALIRISNEVKHAN